MPDTTISLSRIQAVELYGSINAMSGPGNYKLLRSRVQEKILEAWPEIKDNTVETKPEDVRKVSISGREQKSLAEGLLSLINKKDDKGQEVVTGAEFNFFKGIAKVCKVSKWLSSQLKEEEVEDFEGSLDGEPPVSDEVAAD